ncbi:ASCH domain-containing protein [Bradyrhizobium sp. DN5]|uniref:ASCH domain-containing protein n=1 Tax=Bradyrhizobium sp. DN5 TaxID=3056950 RepID=UPI0035258622
MKGLIIDEPWISLILAGKKTWEMRKTACHHRGRIALIRKGSGQVVGIADIVDSLSPLSSLSAYREAELSHRIPPERQGQAFADGWQTPWVLANAKPLVSPVSYKHPSGAVIWVNLDIAVIRAVEAQIGLPDQRQDIPIETHSVGLNDERTRRPSLLRRAVSWLQPWAPTEPSKPQPTPGAEKGLPLHEPASVTSRLVRVTGGNVRNKHIYLPLDFFPADAIGGSNKTDLASRTISVTFNPGSTVETDIDRTKRILRARGPVGDFFTRAGVKEGDSIHLSNTAPYRYEITKVTDA